MCLFPDPLLLLNMIELRKGTPNQCEKMFQAEGHIQAYVSHHVAGGAKLENKCGVISLVK